MPRKDPEAAKAASRDSMRKLRNNRKKEKLSGDPSPTPPRPAVATHNVTLSPEGLTREDWAKQLVALGVSWINQSNQILAEKPKDAIAVGMAGVDLVNANIAFLPSDRVGEPQRGSMLVADRKFLNDPEFRGYAMGMLRRKREILEAEAAAAQPVQPPAQPAQPAAQPGQPPGQPAQPEPPE